MVFIKFSVFLTCGKGLRLWKNWANDSLMSDSHEPGNVFADNIKLQVDCISWTQGMKIGVLIGVGNDGYGKTILHRIETGQADTVDTNGPLLHCEVPSGGVIAKIKKPASVLVLDGCNGS